MIDIPENLEAELQRFCQEQRLSPEDGVRELLRHFVVQRFGKLRRESLDALGPDATETDGEAFDETS
ncbi:MAG: hypothetical protein ACOC46_00145 [Pirellulales bacterium]